MTTTASTGLSLKLSHLSKAFDGKTVLNDIDLEIPAGQFTVIIGRSGCGKSTLLRLIAGLETPSSGGIQFNESPAKPLDPRLRVVFQDSRLLPWKNVIGNVTLGKRNFPLRQRAQKLLEHVGLADRAKDWPSILSGGQRQRIAFARALATRPDLLLFDEPLGALDALTRLDMQDLLERLWLEEKYTSILITHDVEEAIALGDRVILIEKGKITLDLPIDLPRPRDRDSPAFTSLRHDILSRLKNRSTP
ncbi:MAG: ABC transporter ATP-binding protein [Luteolibacter sp.]